MSADTKISVIVPAYNAEQTIAYQLHALAGQNVAEPWEVIVVDDGSTDNTAALVNAHRSALTGLRLVSLSERSGAGSARNAGAQLARGTLYLFCDADDVVDPNWVRELASALDSSLAAVGGKCDETVLNDVTSPHWHGPFFSDGLPVGWWFLPYALTANLGVKAKAFWAVHGFDETLRLGGEDVDLCWRLQLNGGVLGYAPKAIVQYRHRSSLAASLLQAFHWGRVGVLLVSRYRTKARNPPHLEPARYRILRLLKQFSGMCSGQGSPSAWLWQGSYEIGTVFGILAHLLRGNRGDLNAKKHPLLT